MLGLSRGCCSSPPCHSPTTPCPAHGALLGATGLLLGSVLGIRKEQQPSQGSSARCLWVLDVLSLQQQVPIIPRITGCSELAGPPGTWSPTLKDRAHTGPAPQPGPQEHPALPALGGARSSGSSKATGTRDGHCGEGAAEGFLEELWAKHTASRSTPRTVPPQGARSGSPVQRAFLMERVNAALIDSLTQRSNYCCSNIIAH